MNKIKWMSLILLVFFCLSACEKKQAPPSQTSQQDVTEAENLKAVTKAEEDIAKIKQEIAELKLRAEKATADEKKKLQPLIRDIETKIVAAEEKIKELAATLTKWKNLKAGVKNSLEQLKQTIQENKPHFQKLERVEKAIGGGKP